MKQKFFTQLVFVFFFALVTHFASAQTVYVTETGKKFHKKNCSVAAEGKKGMELPKAKKAGFEACNVCKPEEKATSAAPKSEATDPKKKK